jgi:hypothetical protein
MITYKNKNDKPIIRNCYNCKNYVEVNASDKLGYCSANKLMFAYTMQDNVYFLVKSFYLCERHEFKNEEYLRSVSEHVNMRDVIKNKEDVAPK